MSQEWDWDSALDRCKESLEARTTRVCRPWKEENERRWKQCRDCDREDRLQEEKTYGSKFWVIDEKPIPGCKRTGGPASKGKSAGA